MPIFIDELVFRGEVVPSPRGTDSGNPQGAGADGAAADRQALMAEVTQAVIDHLERALERVGER
jgi:hypothetical protein